MRSLAFIGLGTLLSVSCATAQNIDDHLQICLSGKYCENDQKQFKKWFPLAFKKDYQGQRNVAYFLQDGGNGAVLKNEPLSCAWRMVILSSGSPKVDQIDKNNFINTCGRLDTIDRGIARHQADELSQKIYRRDIPADIALGMAALPKR